MSLEPHAPRGAHSFSSKHMCKIYCQVNLLILKHKKWQS